MLIKIANVAKSGSDRTYANDITGRVFFPRTKTMELVAGQYAYAIKTTQTMTTDEDGNLVKLETPREIWQITATFPDKVSAIEAAAEVGTLEAEVAAEVQKVAKTLNLSEAAVAKLAGAAF